MLITGTYIAHVPTKSPSGILRYGIEHHLSHPKWVECSMGRALPIVWKGKHRLYLCNSSLTALPPPTDLHWKPFANKDLQLSANPPMFQQLILYNITNFVNIAVDDYFAQMQTQINILHELGLTSTGSSNNAKVNFASNVMTYGLLNFMYNSTTSFYSIWVFSVCLVATIAMTIRIISCCCSKLCAWHIKARRQQIATILNRPQRWMNQHNYPGTNHGTTAPHETEITRTPRLNQGPMSTIQSVNTTTSQYSFHLPQITNIDQPQSSINFQQTTTNSTSQAPPSTSLISAWPKYNGWHWH